MISTACHPRLKKSTPSCSDQSPRAWEHLVDRLLASPRYGEQWGRHWLDVVRFAESDGYEYDTHRPDAYRYRDYVVQSFNADKPYDQFVKEQLAGDEMDPSNETYMVASGFNRLGPLRKNAGNQNVASSRNEVLTEMTNIVGAAFLGVTVGCARCHDHKFDPFRQSDYYRLQAFFSQTQPQRPDPRHQGRAGRVERPGRPPSSSRCAGSSAKCATLPRRKDEICRRRLDALDEQMPLPLTAIYAVKDDPKERLPHPHAFSRRLSPAHRASVGARLWGCCCPIGAPEDPVTTAKPRLQSGRTG